MLFLGGLGLYSHREVGEMLEMVRNASGEHHAIIDEDSVKLNQTQNTNSAVEMT